MPALDFERKGDVRLGNLDLGLSLLGGVWGVGDLANCCLEREEGLILPPMTHKEVERAVEGMSVLSCHITPTGDKGHSGPSVD